MMITIIPKSKRAKDRVSTHGNMMILLEDHPQKFLVQSTNKTWRKQFWKGWFLKEIEADFIVSAQFI